MKRPSNLRTRRYGSVRTIQICFFGIGTKVVAYFGLQQYDQAIEWARRSIAINPNFAHPHGILAAALALTGHEAEARDALERYMALRKFKSIAAVKAALPPPSADPRVRASLIGFMPGLSRACARPGCRKNKPSAIFLLNMLQRMSLLLALNVTCPNAAIWSLSDEERT